MDLNHGIIIGILSAGSLTVMYLAFYPFVWPRIQYVMDRRAHKLEVRMGHLYHHVAMICDPNGCRLAMQHWEMARWIVVIEGEDKLLKAGFHGGIERLKREAVRSERRYYTKQRQMRKLLRRDLAQIND
ncbi:MAG: hypothetical protein KGI49_00570 [Patescibacteria group bacterium]|nr:hypothetical protein [Patescibacteria group bacterium]